MIHFVLVAVPGSLLLGQGVSFLAPVNASVGDGFPPVSAAMAVADFNGDGKPDIAVSIPNPQFLVPGFVLFGNGDGTFRSGPTVPGGKPWIGDVNGDGKPDLIIAEPGVSIVMSNGDGTFQAPVQVPACAELSLAAVADFNGDKRADLICGTTVLLGNGDGTFRTGVTVDPGQADIVVLTADFNNDGKPDLLLQRLSGELAVALGNGDGTFGVDLPATTLPFGDPSLFSLVVGDFNGDGKLDLAGSGTRAGLLCVALGNGDGTFGTVIINQGLSGEPMAAADFNGDGKLDLVASGGMVLAGNGDGTFRVPVFIQSGSVAIADFNGDKSPDIADGVANSGVIAVLLNDSPGDGFLTAGVSSATLRWPIGPVSIASAFGTNLALQTAPASGNSSPTTLGGIRVHVRDSTGDTLAPLLYVSPTQINYVMTSSDTFAFIGIERVGSTYVEKGIGVSIGPLEPGFYSVGAGLAAASALSVSANYTETEVPVVSCDIAGCDLVPIDVSANPVYLSLYGTGFGSATAASVTCTVAGQNALVTYAGPQMQAQGLDQLNMLLPKTLAGMGAVSVSCFFGSEGVYGIPANAVQIAIK